MKSLFFCKKCGKILQVKKDNKGSSVGTCTCGFSTKIEGQLSFSEKLKNKKEIGEGVIKETPSVGFPFPHTCKKCGHEESEVIDLGAQVSDEANVYLYKCKKCGYVERQADGSCNY